jgi:hypothetical protein
VADEIKRRGRPPKNDADVKRHPLGVRTTKALKEKLEAAAASTGRSVAQEVEYRLEESFRGEKHIAIPLDLLKVMIQSAEMRTGQIWTEDFSTWVAVQRAAIAMIRLHRPDPPNAASIADAEREVERRLEQWTTLPDTGIRVLRSGTLDAEKTKAADQELERASAGLREIAAPAKAMFEAGQEVADDVLDALRLTPRKS